MRRLLALAALAVPALLAPACGGDDDEPGRTVTVPAGRAIPVVADEYDFDPQTIVVTGARGPTRVTFSLANEGVLAHNLRVFRDGDELGGTPTFQGGRARTGTLTLPPGSYRLVCTVGDHEELGMVGRLELR